MSESETRIKIIDPLLAKRKWPEIYIKKEVNTVRTDFKNKKYVLFDGKPEKGGRFIDYLLLNEDYSPLAIIEAKKYSKDEDEGRIQARSYAQDIYEQTGKIVPIFLTNGHEWRFIDEDRIERKVSGPFSQEDLKRRSDIFSNKRNPKDVKTDTKIVDRTKSIEIVRKLAEHFSEGYRLALIQMATGTGKTRVAMAIIKLLINANMVRNVLFVADRIALANQAKSSGFKKFFSEPVGDLREEVNQNSRLYVSTIQTLSSGRMYEKFSPAFFDLIIFDEAHRSIYDTGNHIVRYFDAIKIGLTATPRNHESKNTYELFGCENGKPTVEYSYDEAVLNGVLVPYKAHIIDTKILSLGIRGSELTKDQKDELRRQEEMDPDSVEFSGSQFDRVFMDDKTNEIVIREFMNSCIKTADGKPCKSIFFCASQRHAKHVKDIFDKLFPRMGGDVQVITSNMHRAEDEVKRFQNRPSPRIALSVGMLDTGIDVPEVCNLVFVKPVFSPIRFWQMIGRGTRSISACTHRDWLPSEDESLPSSAVKDYFLILDFAIGGFSNIKYHEEFRAETERSVSKDTITKIFENRVSLLEKSMNESQKNMITDKIISSIEAIDKESFIAREKLPEIEKITGNRNNLDKYVNKLLREIAPLMLLNQGENSTVTSFILHSEKLFGYILDRNYEKIDKIRTYVQDMTENVLQKDNLEAIRKNRDNLIKVMGDEFWEELAFEDVEFIVKDIAPLMKYFEPNPRKVYKIDAEDIILSKEHYERQVREDPSLEYFINSNKIIRKIRDGEGITSPELLELERQLSELRPEITIDNIQRVRNKDFLIFIHEIIGLSGKYDPKELIKQRFDEFIIKNNNYSSRQLEFLQLLRNVFADRKRIELTDLAKSPLKEEHPRDYFQIPELTSIVDKCKKIKMI